MKQLIRPLLVSTFTAFLLAFCNLRSNADVVASISVTEAQENGLPVILNIPGLADQDKFSTPTVVLDSNGTVSDVFGVIDVGQDNQGNPIPFLAFLSARDTELQDFLLNPHIEVPEGSGVLPATMYLAKNLRDAGYTAQFFSSPVEGSPSDISDSLTVFGPNVQGVPDAGATSALLGVSLSGVFLLRKKLSRSF